jgi:hypothetical protein
MNDLSAFLGVLALAVVLTVAGLALNSPLITGLAAIALGIAMCQLGAIASKRVES